MKRLLLIGLCLVCLSCAGGKYPPSQITQADLSLQKFRDLFLQGRFCAAEDAFKTAIKKYASVDSPCDMAEAYLQRYLMFSYIGMVDEESLRMATQYASLDDACGQEMARIEGYKKSTVETAEEDPLSRSVALRKKALKDANPALLKEALVLDRAQGWSALLWQDLKLLVQLTEGPESTKYQKRLKDLKKALELWCLKKAGQ
jgi:tetratricopeptide (TPR) repeat protein